MIIIKFNPDWLKGAHTEWDPSFDPTKHMWVVDDGRFHNDNEWVDLICLNSHHGEFFRIARERITLRDITNLYNSTLSAKNDHYGYDGNGKWTFFEDGGANLMRGM